MTKHKKLLLEAFVYVYIYISHVSIKMYNNLILTGVWDYLRRIELTESLWWQQTCSTHPSHSDDTGNLDVLPSLEAIRMWTGNMPPITTFFFSTFLYPLRLNFAFSLQVDSAETEWWMKQRAHNLSQQFLISMSWRWRVRRALCEADSERRSTGVAGVLSGLKGDVVQEVNMSCRRVH